MAYVPDIRHPGHGPAWQTKKEDKQYNFETTDGTKYTLYVPSSQQFNAYKKSFKKHNDVFDQIKADVKDDAAIAKNGDGLPMDFDHIAWAALLSSTLKKLNKTWGVNDKIWIRNKNDDGTKSTVAVVAITPVKTQSNAKRTARKVSAASVAAETTADDDDDGYIRPEDIVFGTKMLPPITQKVYVRTENGNKYFYLNEEDAMKGNSNYSYTEEIPREEDEADEYEEGEEEEEEEEEEEVEDRDTALARMIEEDARIAEEEARIADEYARIAEEEARIEEERARIAEQARIEEERARKEKERNLKLRTAIRRRADLAKHAGAEAPDSVAKQARIEEPARITEADRIAAADHIAELARIAADPRLVEASRDLPAGWKAFISKTYDTVYYYKPSPDGKGEGTKVWEKPTAGGKRTKKRLRRKSTSKQLKKKRTTTRRKMTTTRRK